VKELLTLDLGWFAWFQRRFSNISNSVTMADNYQLNLSNGFIFPGKHINIFCDATKELTKAECFSLVNSDPMLIAISLAKVSYFFLNKIHTISTGYNNIDA
jgi:hypothetical protein